MFLSTSLWCLYAFLGYAHSDTEVSCVFGKSCILPCSFLSGTNAIIHWVQTAENQHVHSYFYNQDQLSHQNHLFKGRTSLFEDQISRGNASLLLTGVQVKDEGRYKCYTSSTSGNKESYIDVQVDAPVHQVNIDQKGPMITCSAHGIYPEPKLSWSINLPSNVTLNSTSTVHQTEQQLYNISSSLIVSDTDVVYSCSVSTRRNRRRTSLLFKPRNERQRVWLSVPTLIFAAVTAALACLVRYSKKERRTGVKETVNKATSHQNTESDHWAVLRSNGESDLGPTDLVLLAVQELNELK